LSVVDAVPTTGSGSQTQWHNGWTVGAGWEYGITANCVKVGLNYRFGWGGPVVAKY
jgi:outer membrane immunogenic protein